MASNKHWPSMFKSKPSNTSHHHQWQQHDLSSCNRNPYTPGPGCEERTPEPKPRWNPRPEQIRILESIFNSGMVNPPRDEIRKIRAQLQEYGQVGDANVFYWFQNRKSRSKHKQRQLLQNKSQNGPPTQPLIATTISSAVGTPPSSSSSSSDKSSPNNNLSSSNVIDLLNSPTSSVNQPYFQITSGEFLTEPYFFPVVQGNNGGSAGFCFPEHVTSCVADQTVGNCLLGELMLMNNGPPSKKADYEKLKMQQHQIAYGVAGAPNTADHPFLHPSLSTNHMLQGAGLGESGPPKSTVFINDVCFEVAVGPFNVRDAFGDDAMLIQSSGQPVVTNEWGVTIQPLQHGAFYYLVRAFSPSPNDRTIDLQI